MQFESRTPAQALGWVLAHSVSLAGVQAGRLPKGTRLSQSDVTQLQTAGIEEVHVFRLEPHDIEEDEAALQLATAVAGDGLRLGTATRGRCNLHAEGHGLLLVDRRVDALNAADEAVTLATLPHMARVAANQLVATAKIIPYGTDRRALDAALGAGAQLSLAPFRPFTARLITTGAQLPDKTRLLTEARLKAVRGDITRYDQAPHTVSALADAIVSAAADKPDLLLILGVSAISDRRDVVPAALEAGGGEVISLGMPVDPGNLLMLGALSGTTVLGLPGCARSPALNGLDWVLERFAARLPVGRSEIAAMGIGGLLKETPHRPEPRAPLHRRRAPTVQPVVLAAGRSSRAGGANKLLSVLKGHPVIRQTVALAGQEAFLPPFVVTGHRADSVSGALYGLPHQLVANPDFTSGMASSLKAALAHCGGDTELLLVCLGDMPFVQPSTFAALTETANRLSEAKIFIPTFNGKRGNPVVWHRDMFGALAEIEGDKGGRDVIHANAPLVCEVPVDDPGILIDLDTPEALAQFGIKPAP